MDFAIPRSLLLWAASTHQYGEKPDRVPRCFQLWLINAEKRTEELRARSRQDRLLEQRRLNDQNNTTMDTGNGPQSDTGDVVVIPASQFNASKAQREAQRKAQSKTHEERATASRKRSMRTDLGPYDAAEEVRIFQWMQHIPLPGPDEVVGSIEKETAEPEQPQSLSESPKRSSSTRDTESSSKRRKSNVAECVPASPGQQTSQTPTTINIRPTPYDISTLAKSRRRQARKVQSREAAHQRQVEAFLPEQLQLFAQHKSNFDTTNATNTTTTEN